MHTRNIFCEVSEGFLTIFACTEDARRYNVSTPLLLVPDTMRSLALLLGVKAACILLVSSLSGTGAVNNSGRWW